MNSDVSVYVLWFDLISKSLYLWAAERPSIIVTPLNELGDGWVTRTESIYADAWTLISFEPASCRAPTRKHRFEFSGNFLTEKYWLGKCINNHLGPPLVPCNLFSSPTHVFPLPALPHAPSPVTDAPCYINLSSALSRCHHSYEEIPLK